MSASRSVVGFPDRSEPLVTVPQPRYDRHDCKAQDHDQLLCDLERAESGDWISGVYARATIQRDQMYLLRPWLTLDVIQMREWLSPQGVLRKMSHA